MNKQTKATLSAVALFLLLLAGVWALWGDGVDPAVAALDAERQRVFSGEATDAERDAFRQRVDALTEDQRRQLFGRGRPEMQRRMAERMNEIFSMPTEQIRAEAKQRAAHIVANRNRPDEGDRPPGPPGGRSDMTEAQRDARAKQRLDFVDPGARGQFSEFRRMINEELESNGHDPMSRRDVRGMMRGGRGPG